MALLDEAVGEVRRLHARARAWAGRARHAHTSTIYLSKKIQPTCPQLMSWLCWHPTLICWCANISVVYMVMKDWKGIYHLCGFGIDDNLLKGLTWVLKLTCTIFAKHKNWCRFDLQESWFRLSDSTGYETGSTAYLIAAVLLGASSCCVAAVVPRNFRSSPWAVVTGSLPGHCHSTQIHL
jgi:hypothetical protein